ncbi:hypothetical protein ACIBK8_07495 [Streptomyces sp. NPDC050161]|uniref:hypothetical protein n=1 Tax=Streptomyces sp. NPDC050161 TaxID=3365604 RepID=UPI0037A3910B
MAWEPRHEHTGGDAHRPAALTVAFTTASAHALPAAASPCAEDRPPHAPAAAH